MGFKVIAVDPGGTTGITIARKEGKIINIVSSQERMSCEEFMRFLMLHVLSTTHFVIEDFEFRKRAREGLDLTPAHLIGVAMAIVPPEKVRFQKASEGKSHFADNNKIKDLGLWLPGKPHAMDSLRHFLQWYTFGPGFKYHDKATTLQLEPSLPN